MLPEIRKLSPDYQGAFSQHPVGGHTLLTDGAFPVLSNKAMNS